MFTGHDTKVMKNSAKSRYKMSNVELLTNKSIGLILLSQIILASIGAANGSYYSHYLSQTDAWKNENGYECDDPNA